MWKFSVKKPYTVLVGVVLAIVLGYVSFGKMTADLLPNINLPYVLIMTTYVGASPETVEATVTEPIEGSMATVTNIEEIRSVSNENYSMVILQFAQSANMDSASLEIREKLDQIKSRWDDAVSNPVIMKLNPDMLPVMIAAVGVEGMDQAQISDYVQEVTIPGLESIEGVASASATGLLQESVNVIISPDKIDKLNEKIYAAIDEKMADAAAEIENGKQGIEDGKKELEKGKKELLSGQKEMQNGQAELDKGKDQLEAGKKELEEKQKTTTAQLAAQKTQLLSMRMSLQSYKDDLDQAKMLNDQMIPLKAVIDLGSGNMTAYTDAMTALGTAAATLAVNPTDMAALADMNTAVTTIDGLKAKVISASAGLATMTEALPAPVKNSLTQALATDFDWKAAENVTTVATALGAVDGIAGNSMLITQYNSLKDALNSLTKGLGYDAYLAMINTTVLGELNKTLPAESKVTSLAGAIAYMDSVLAQLEQGQLTAAIEFANGKTTLALTEIQLKDAQAKLDEGRKQISDGLSKLDDAKKQLEDGEQQLADGEQQLEDAKEAAYKQADMVNILTVDTVKGLLTAQNFTMPAGYVVEDGASYLIRVGDKPDTIEALRAMPLMDLHMDNVPVVTLEDVADVFYTDNSKDIYTNVNGSAGVMVSIQKQTGYSTGDVSDKLGERFQKMMDQDDKLQIITMMDQGIYIDMVMDSIIDNILLGALLSILILLLFLKDLRPTLVVAFSIPISLVTAIVCMYFSGVTLNVISLSGLALGIGMLVDNSIVVIENIYRMRNEGMDAKEAAIEGAKEVAGAIFASTLTTVCVFAPIVFTEGITRQLFVDMGLTIGYSLMASLIIALTVVPAMASKMLTRTKIKTEGKFFGGLAKGYTKLLAGSLRVKPLVFILALGLLGGSIYLALQNGTAFMPQMDSPQLTISVRLDKEATLDDTRTVTNEVIDRISTIPEITDIGAMTGGNTMSMLAGGGDGGNVTSANVYVRTVEDREKTNEELIAEINELTADIDAKISVQGQTMDMSALGGSGISLQIRGRDLDKLREIATEVAEIVGQVEGTADVNNGLAESEEELRIIVNKEKAANYGLTVAQVFQQIYPKIAAASASTRLVTLEKDYDIYVTNAADTALTRETVKELVLTGKDKDQKAVDVPMKEIVDFEDALSLTSINRQEQSRYIAVSAKIAEGYNIGLVANDVEKALDGYELPDGYSIVSSGENDTINEAISQLMLMLLLAVLFMYLIMVAQFQSLLSPFIIMFTIPLAFTGGFMGLYVTGSEISVVALIGFIMLSGIIVNNGIVIIDYMNQLIESGMEKKEAILTAGRTRLRPVLMTALTTILALSTMVFSDDMGATMSKPMAIVTIGGLLYGTLLTLVVIPCVYDVVVRGKKKAKKAELQVDKTETI